MKKILIADDDPATLDLLTEAFGHDEFAITTAADGNTAFEKLTRDKFDLLLTDIRMPGLSGLELLARLRQKPDSPRAIVMTSDDTTEVMLQAVREQAYHYVRKPLDLGVLLDLVRDALSAKQSSAPIEVLSAVPHWVELLVPCELEAVGRITGFMAQLKSELSEADREQLGTAFRELLTNAIEWGGKLDPNQKVRISCLRTPHMLQYRIADPGRGFRLDELDHAAVSNPPDDPLRHDDVRREKGLRPGGYGIYMVRGLVDELLYNEAHNEVVLIKYITPS